MKISSWHQKPAISFLSDYAGRDERAPAGRHTSLCPQSAPVKGWILRPTVWYWCDMVNFSTPFFLEDLVVFYTQRSPSAAQFAVMCDYRETQSLHSWCLHTFGFCCETCPQINDWMGNKRDTLSVTLAFRDHLCRNHTDRQLISKLVKI